jgi:CheY-like chemotaxis protein
MLEPLGYQVTSVNNSRAALVLWGQNPESYDLLITDQVMPELSGAELVKHVHASRPNLPVIIWSGYSENLDLESARALGVRAYLMKPFSRGQLADAVASALASP